MSFSPRWDAPSATPHAWPSGAACAALTGWHAVLHEDDFPGHPPAALLYGRALLFRPTSILNRRWGVNKAFAEITFSVILGHLSSIYRGLIAYFRRRLYSRAHAPGLEICGRLEGMRQVFIQGAHYILLAGGDGGTAHERLGPLPGLPMCGRPPPPVTRWGPKHMITLRSYAGPPQDP